MNLKKSCLKRNVNSPSKIVYAYFDIFLGLSQQGFSIIDIVEALKEKGIINQELNSLSLVKTFSRIKNRKKIDHTINNESIRKETVSGSKTNLIDDIVIKSKLKTDHTIQNTITQLNGNLFVFKGQEIDFEKLDFLSECEMKEQLKTIQIDRLADVVKISDAFSEYLNKHSCLPTDERNKIFKQLYNILESLTLTQTKHTQQIIRKMKNNPS